MRTLSVSERSLYSMHSACSVVYMIPRSAVLVQHRRVTDRRQTAKAYTMLPKRRAGKNDLQNDICMFVHTACDYMSLFLHV